MVTMKGKTAGLKPLGKAVFIAAAKNERFEALAGKIKLLVPADCSLISV